MRGARETWGGRRNWLQGVGLAAVLVLGVLLGVVVGARACSPAVEPTVREEHYLVLLATLYSHGENLEDIRARLTDIGYDNATEALLSLAEEYSISGDRKQQRQAEDLRQLAEALIGVSPAPTVPTQPTASPTGLPDQVVAEATPVTSSTPVPVVVDTPTQTAATQPVATPTPLPSRGRIQSSDGQSVNLRTEPTSQGSDVIELLAVGTEVEVLDLVEGEAIDPVEGRWFKVKHGEFVGYVYYKLINTVE